MALAAREDCTVLREWAPLTDLFQKLPTKTNSSLFNSNLKLTCVDVIKEYIALGTNCGIVYCYDRKRKDLQRLRCENDKAPITVVKIISTVDYMVACGNKEGNITIFQIPKVPPDTLPASLRPKKKQVERYTVSEMHKGAVSAIEWSKNGMKLFSGDCNGQVILTEIDFFMHLCKSVEVLDEAYQVVQLSYYQHQLMVSTTYRTIVCQKQDKWRVTQVGKKDRKVLGNFGGVFYQNGLRPTDVVLYCSRPGLRMWISDIEGTVQQTLLFRDILKEEFPEVPILNPISTNLKRLKPNKEASFGCVLPFSDDNIVTYNNDVVYVLSPKDMKIVSTVSHLRGVLDVAVNHDEIFILEGERSLIRVAFNPETSSETVTPPDNSKNAFLPINAILEIKNKIQTTTISAVQPLTEIAKILPTTDLSPTNSVEEAAENEVNKFISTQPSYADQVYETYRKLETFNKISEQEFDDRILFKHRRRKKPADAMLTSISSTSSNSSDERDVSVAKATVMDVSTVSILPDLRSPETIQNDIVEKEKMLANLLGFDPTKINSEKRKEESNQESRAAPIDQSHVGSKPIKLDAPPRIKNTVKYESQGTFTLNDSVDDVKISKPVEEESKTTMQAEPQSSVQTDKPRKQIVNGDGKKVESNFGAVAKIIPNGLKVDIPDCRAMPESWKVFELSLQKKAESPDPSLADWEIV